jgi:outer membrane biosynthesis protein TonB
MSRPVVIVSLVLMLSILSVGQNKGICPSPRPTSAKKRVVQPTENEITVPVSVIVSDTGYVCSVQLLQHIDKGTDAAVIGDVRSWKFRPSMKDGHPVAVQTEVQVKLKRNESGKLVVVSSRP